ncbi:hypothetical protein Hanom_Chr17g01541101 [Helianthus anomalus]
MIVTVPKGWDKLSLSLISVETGKAIAKTGRSLVQNGNCQWTENLSVYIWDPHDDASKGHGQSLHKLLISMGSDRPGILGEVAVNLSSHLSSETSTTVKSNTRNDRWTDTDSFVEDANASDDLDTTSDVSDGRTTKSVESSMSSNFMYTLKQVDLVARYFFSELDMYSFKSVDRLVNEPNEHEHGHVLVRSFHFNRTRTSNRAIFFVQVRSLRKWV